jgi:hypothetical protein
VVFAANAFRRREFAVRAPGEQPSFHIVVLDVVPGFYLAISMLKLRKHSFLVGDIGLDRIGNEEVGAPAGCFRQLRQSSFDFWF